MKRSASLVVLSLSLLAPWAPAQVRRPERSRPIPGPLAASLQRLEPGAMLRFRPFPDVTLRIGIEIERTGTSGARILRARVFDDELGWARIVVQGEAVVAEIASPRFGDFELRPQPGGTHLVRQVSRRGLECAGALPSLQRLALQRTQGSAESASPGAPLSSSSLAQAPTAPGSAPDREISSSPDPVGPTLDVLVVYTSSARSLAGGVAAIEATIESYIDYTNQAFATSGVHAGVRLVGASEIAYDESGNSLTDLARLRALNDGFMDDVHPLRDLLGADVVSLIATSGSAGTAYLMEELSTDFADRAFSAIGHDVGGLAFAHELGHIMGSNHNNAPGAPGLFCYSFGHRTPDLSLRTIMSSGPGEFVDFFSSPALMAGGFPLGVDGDGCPADAADNVRSLNGSADTVAAFRPTQVP